MKIFVFENIFLPPIIIWGYADILGSSVEETSWLIFFIYFFFFSGAEHPREDKPDPYYWAEITGQHTQTLDI